MLIPFKLIYEVNIIPKGKRKHIIRSMSEEVFFEPILAKKYPMKAITYDFQDVYVHDDRFYAYIGSNENILKNLSSDRIMRQITFQKYTDDIIDNDDVKTFISSNKEQMMKRFLEWASQTLIYEGHVFIPVCGPYVCLENGYLIFWHSDTSRFPSLPINVCQKHLLLSRWKETGKKMPCNLTPEIVQHAVNAKIEGDIKFSYIKDNFLEAYTQIRKLAKNPDLNYDVLTSIANCYNVLAHSMPTSKSLSKELKKRSSVFKKYALSLTDS